MREREANLDVATSWNGVSHLELESEFRLGGDLG